jgi:nucleotide-binding universal stress UspA family protein
MYKRILVPLDGSKNDDIVLSHIKVLAKEWQASVTLILLYRLAKSDDPFDKQIQMEDGSSGYRAKQRAITYLPKLEESLKKDGLEITTEFLVSEDPDADVIVNYALQNQFDVIALTSRDRSPFGSFFFGNVEEKVRRRSPLPVLFVPERAVKENNK